MCPKWALTRSSELSKGSFCVAARSERGGDDNGGNGGTNVRRPKSTALLGAHCGAYGSPPEECTCL
eukprot:1462803-Alexandrium_andersonii.AAC.1